MEAVVEFHSFKDNHYRFIEMELAVVSKYIKSQIVFKAPFSKSLLNSKMTRTANWFSSSFRNIDWNDGRFLMTNAPCVSCLILFTQAWKKLQFCNSFTLT